MANFQHLKASRTRVLDTFPTNSFGNDGDIVISRISGRGVFICTKAGGMWYVANQMQELARIGKATLKELNADKLTIKNIENAQNSIDSYIVSDLGNIKSKTGKQLVDDLPLPINNISYKQAYCSLERYTDEETCKANGGTWYYSTNDTHDSISNTAENQLLTIGQTHNSVDTEPTLLYDGSVLEIKRNTEFDENWQTSANIHTLKLSYDSLLNSTLGTDSSGNLRITSTSTHTSGTLLINNIPEIGSDTDKFLMSDSGVVKFVTGDDLRSYIGAGTGDGDITSVVAGDGLTGGATSGDATLNVNVDDSTIETNSDALRIKDDGVTYAKLQNVTNARMLGNNAGSDGVVTEMTKANVLSFLNVEDGATAGGASALNDLSDVSYSSGDLSINLLDTIVSPATLTIDSGGDIVLDADGGDVFVKDNGSTLIQLTNNAVVVGEATYGNNLVIYDGDDLLAFATEELTITNYLKIAETANANSDTAGKGQLWVKNDTPNCLAFTDDAGADIIGVGKYHYDTKIIGYSAFQTTSILPITGYVFEATTGTARNEFTGFLAPYNCRVEKFCFRSEIAQNGTLILRVIEAQDGTEVPGTQIYRKDHTVDIADDTFLELDMTSPGIGSDFAPMTKGRLYFFQITTPTNSADTNVSVVLRYDITT